jgi:hypothetical protein
VAVAEIHVSLWMCEQIRLMARLKEEFGWVGVLKFAYEHSRPEWKSVNL